MRILFACVMLLGLIGNGMAQPKSARPKTVPAAARELLLNAAMEIQETELDCSHLVHYLYRQAGLYYAYAPSRTLYKGVNSFRRVINPQPGDLIVWRGHVGVVVDPAEHSFVSALRTGVKVASYTSTYWKGRGRPRFLRFTGPVFPPDLMQVVDINSASAVVRDSAE